MEELFFKDTQSLLRVAVCTVIAFTALFLFIRISGKRTLSKLNAFDFVVSVSMGSTLSSMILSKVTLAEGCVALIIIIGMQFLLAWLSKQSHKMEKVINSVPALLFYEGVFFEDVMSSELITKDEILAEIRKFRLEKLDSVKAVILELNGELTVVKKSSLAGESSLQDLIIDE